MIKTIGDLAKSDVREIERLLGKNGKMLWVFANGLDSSPVLENEAVPQIKSIGNSQTTPRDLTTLEDMKIILRILSESVAQRLRKHRYKCTTVQISIRTSDLQRYERQGQLLIPSNTSSSIYKLAFALYQKHHTSAKPIRSVGVRGCGLISDKQSYQLSFMEDESEKQERLEQAIDNLRSRFGHFAVQRGIMLCDKSLSGFDPGEHVIHPQPFTR